MNPFFLSFQKIEPFFSSPSSKQMAIEVDNLNARVVEAETRLKSEVTKIKKKMQIVITELEMTLDTANKSNIDLQKTVKKQAISLQVWVHLLV